MKVKNLLSRATLVALVVVLAAAVGGYRLFFRATAVETVPVREGAIQEEIHGPGTLQARIPVTVSSRVTGVIISLHADQGDAVRRGQLLATLDDRDSAAKAAAAREAVNGSRHNAAAAEAALAKAGTDLVLARSNQQRNSALQQQRFISQAAMDASTAALRAAESAEQGSMASLAARRAEARSIGEELRYAEALLSYSRIAAPMDGIIIRRNAEVGSTVVPGSPVLQMVDPQTLWVAVRIDESVAGRIVLGQRARIRLRTGGEVAGKVVRIAQQSDAATREIEVDVAFDAPPKRFAIDQEAEVTILADTTTGLVVPVASLFYWKGAQGVLVLREGRAQFQPVRTGVAGGASVLVQEGLAAGQRVLAKPSSVQPGERVRPAAQGS